MKKIFVFSFLLISASLFAQERPAIVDWYQANRTAAYMQLWDEVFRAQVAIQPGVDRADMYRFYWCWILTNRGENIPSTNEDMIRYSSSIDQASAVYKAARDTGLSPFDVIIRTGRYSASVIELATQMKALYDYSRSNRLFVL